MVNHKRKCPECGSASFIYDETRGELICSNCGLVVEEQPIERGREWREFEEGKRRGRAGAPLSLQKFDLGLSTSVGKNIDLYRLSTEKKTRKFFRLKKWQERVGTSIERNLRLAMAELTRIASYLNLPNLIRDEAARIYNQILQKGFIRGRNMESVVAACIYSACRTYSIPRTFDEIAEATNVSRKEIGRTYRFIIRKLGVKIKPSDPKDYITRFASILKLSPKSSQDAIKLLKRIESAEFISGRGPAGIAAAALYIAALLNDERRTQREVADVAGVTEVTIRNRYKELLDHLGLEEKIKIREKEKEFERARKKEKEEKRKKKEEKKKE
ncbi:MAG: transcription initiation factor IIB [Candidatus Pacearchaeota archaeon]